MIFSFFFFSTSPFPSCFPVARLPGFLVSTPHLNSIQNDQENYNSTRPALLRFFDRFGREPFNLPRPKKHRRQTFASNFYHVFCYGMSRLALACDAAHDNLLLWIYQEAVYLTRHLFMCSSTENDSPEEECQE